MFRHLEQEIGVKNSKRVKPVRYAVTMWRWISLSTAVKSDDIEKNKGMAIAACFIFFLPLLTDAKSSPFAMHWANQSLLRVFVHIAASVLLVIPILGWVLGPLLHLFGLVLLIMSIMGAARGEAKPLPIIGKYTILKPS